MGSSESKIVSFKVELTASEKSYIRREIETVLESGWLTKGKYTKEFEREFAAKSGAKYCSALSSGTVALDAVLRAFGLDAYEVLVPVNSNFGTLAGVIESGALPVLYDGGLYAHVEEIERALTTRTGGVVVVHIGGYISPEIFAIRVLCRNRGLLLIEDASHAHFAEARGVMAGNIGDAAAFSLFVTKVLTCGEGGMITTSRKDVRDIVNSLRDQGKNAAGMHIRAGNSWRMSEMNAITGTAQLQDVDSTIASLRGIESMYRAAVASSGSAMLPVQPEGWFASGHKFVALVKGREMRKRLTTFMARDGIQLGRGVYEKPLHAHPVFRKYANLPFPLASEFAARHICLPIFRTMTAREVERVIASLNAFALGENPSRWKTSPDFGQVSAFPERG